MSDPRTNLVLAPNVRGGGPLSLHPDILQGWGTYIDNHIEPDLAWMVEQGFKPRFLVHMPYGIFSGRKYELDMRQEAEKRDLTPGDFVMAWRRVTRRAEVIFYGGQVHSDEDFERFWEPGKGFKRYRVDDWMARFTYATRQIIDAGGSMGLDASSDWPEDSVQYAAMNVVRRQCEANGATAYLEPRQASAAEHLHSWAVISNDPFWLRSDPDKYADSARWAARTADLTGEILRWPQVPTGGWGGPAREVAERLAGDVRRIWADGHTAIAAGGVFRKNSIGREDLGL